MPEEVFTRSRRANVVGPQIRRLRYARGWSQAKLAIELQLKGMDIQRDGVAKIEGQTHCVKDRDISYFARALGVKLEVLFPPLQTNGEIYDLLSPSHTPFR